MVSQSTGVLGISKSLKTTPRLHASEFISSSKHDGKVQNLDRKDALLYCGSLYSIPELQCNYQQNQEQGKLHATDLSLNSFEVRCGVYLSRHKCLDLLVC